MSTSLSERRQRKIERRRRALERRAAWAVLRDEDLPVPAAAHLPDVRWKECVTALWESRQALQASVRAAEAAGGSMSVNRRVLIEEHLAEHRDLARRLSSALARASVRASIAERAAKEKREQRHRKT